MATMKISLEDFKDFLKLNECIIVIIILVTGLGQNEMEHLSYIQFLTDGFSVFNVFW